MTHIGVQLASESMMTVSLKVKCHENPLMAVMMNKTLVCMQHAMKCVKSMHVCSTHCMSGKSGITGFVCTYTDTENGTLVG